MSAPDPKDWEVTDAVLQATALALVKAVVSAVARVRALTELKALEKAFDDLGFDGTDEANEEIRNRIAEIEAE